MNFTPVSLVGSGSALFKIKHAQFVSMQTKERVRKMEEQKQLSRLICREGWRAKGWYEHNCCVRDG